MKFVMYQDCVSPHQIPLARELVKRLGAEEFRYVYRDQEQGDRIKLGWQMAGGESWFVHIGNNPTEARALIENADALLTGMRELDLFARRSAKGLKTFYASERWFKPILVELKIPLFTFTSHLHLSLPGFLKLFSPGYFKMACCMARLLTTQPNFYYLPIGPHAARDMRFLCRVTHTLSTKHQALSTKIIPWGYFVEKGIGNREQGIGKDGQSLKVLYVGRFLALKRIDTIIRAVADIAKRGKPITLTLVGSGPEESRLKKLASSIQRQSSVASAKEEQLQTTTKFSPSPSTFIFLPSVPISEVRSIMRQHDVLVFASNAFDGWGAVVNEALSEGIAAVGTYETGASAALLPESQLFHCGDWRSLADKLSTLNSQPLTSTVPRAYTPSGACDILLDYCNGGKLK